MNPVSRYKIHTPEGVQDCLALECFNKRGLEKCMRGVFFAAGYDEVETPTFEYYDVFLDGMSDIQQEHMLKFFDANGRILALRPELTMPIARLCATKLDSFPARLYYVANAYGCENAYYSSQKEFTQAGVELIGERGPEADAEVIALAIEALRSCGVKHFQIDLGQVEFFKGLMEQAGLSSVESEELRAYVDQKNNLAVELFLKGHVIQSEVQKTIMTLPTLYGGAEVFDKAESFSGSARCKAAVQNLRAIFDILTDFGLGEYISIDFGMLQSIEYYSGLIFKGYVGDFGYPILSGGRYDNLISGFGADIPATGCALGIKRILIALEKQGALSDIPRVDYVVSCAKESRVEAFKKISALRSQGYRVQSAMSLDGRELKEYALKRGAQAVYVEVSE